MRELVNPYCKTWLILKSWFSPQGKERPDKRSSSTEQRDVSGELENKALYYAIHLSMWYLNPHLCKNTPLWFYIFTVSSMILTAHWTGKKTSLSNSGMRRLYFASSLNQADYKMKSFIRLWLSHQWQMRVVIWVFLLSSSLQKI